MPTPELIHEQLRPMAHSNSSYAQLERYYSTPGLPPIVVRVTASTGDTWSVVVQVIQPDGSSNGLMSSQIPPQTDSGDSEADRHATLAARILQEAKDAQA